MKKHWRKIRNISFVILALISALGLCAGVMYSRSPSLIVSQDKDGSNGSYVKFPVVQRIRGIQ